MVYKAKVTTENNFKLYYVKYKAEFKSRFTTTLNHFEKEVMNYGFPLLQCCQFLKPKKLLQRLVDRENAVTKLTAKNYEHWMTNFIIYFNYKFPLHIGYLAIEGRIEKLQNTLENNYVLCNALLMWHKALGSMPNREICHCACKPGASTKPEN